MISNPLADVLANMLNILDVVGTLAATAGYLYYSRQTRRLDAENRRLRATLTRQETTP
ncbi:hypothetical protein SV1_48 [Streptomyces phage SV1]|uniref:hypothetical protein n=1 Tax=Streptomyces phage SV1 TaxID=1204525 RepID=UPI00028B280B|nr:hypothetical protein D280_gp48 [Streptomyces phage SV1]AFU62188.1 hypothetical protein SV1_48 [Streptomyces phage SV1]